MNVKRTLIKITVMIIMVFAISSVTENSYAYWATNVTGPTNTSTEGVASVGTWVMYDAWDANTTYVIGDRVSHNGVIYEAKKNNPTKEPGVDGGWNSQWLVVG